MFVHLDGSHDLVAGRLHKRLDHFMPESLLDSQYATLEPLEADERGVVIRVDASPMEISHRIIQRLRLTRLEGATDAIRLPLDDGD